MNMPVNENHELIKSAVEKVINDARVIGYDCDLNAFHLQVMLDYYVKGMDPKTLCEEMCAGCDTRTAFYLVIKA